MGYIVADKREELKDRDVNWKIAIKRGKLKAVAEDSAFCHNRAGLFLEVLIA